MSDPVNLYIAPLKPSRIGLIATYLAFLAVITRTLTSEKTSPILTGYLGFELVFIILFSVAFLRPSLPGWLRHFYFALQSALVLELLSFQPEFDFVVLFFLLLTYQASLFFTGRMRWMWVMGLVLLTGGSLIFHLGLLRGLALSLTTIAAEIVFPAYLIVNQETETARAKSQSLLDELQSKHNQLESYAGQVEELAAMQERNRLARELHDKVSQFMFSISLTTRSAQLLLVRDPGCLPEQLARLQELTTEALSQLRSLISQLRPPQKS